MTHLPHPLVSARRLAARLEAGERFHLLDVRWALGQPSMHEAYLHAHLPGACWVEFEDALSDAVSDDGAGGRHPMPSLDRFQDAMRAAGVRNDVPVVVYDAANGLAAARCWWLLRYFGKLDVQVLDGGLAAWKQAGGALEGGDPTPTQRGDLIATPRHLTLVDADGAEELAARHLLVDARPADRFAGQNETIDPVAGHIPGAVNIPALSNIGADGCFLTSDDLATRFTARGIPRHERVGVYCGSGVQAAHLALALEVSGVFDDPAVYIGSWSDWISDPERPVERD